MTEPTPSDDAPSTLSTGDDPILSVEDDLLNRARLGAAIADEVRAMNAERGAVVAITGRWGTGKTSLLNLTANILHETEEVEIVEFNPWFFSGTDQLIRFFFDEIARQLRSERSRKKRLKDATASIAEKFNRYSVSLSPLKFIPGAGTIIDTVQKTSEGVTEAFSASIHEQRIEISEALSNLNGRIVVLIDDIDRLTRQEIRDLFRLVRLNGSFPNVVYLLSFDRKVVENALTEEGIDGAAYLEKIVKTSVEVPPAADEALASVLRQGMQEAMSTIPTLHLGEDRFPDVFWQIVRPLFSTVRDVKRFLSSLTLTVRSAGDEVALPDLITLEAIRVLRPAAHDLIAQNVATLTTVHGWQSDMRNQAALASDSERIGALVDALPDSVGRALIKYVFPAAQLHTENIWHGHDSEQAWRRDRRVAHTEVLKYYLHRELPSGTAPSSQVDAIFHAACEERAFEIALAQVPDHYLEDTLDRFLAYADGIDSDRIPMVASALLKLFPRFSEESTGMFDFGRDYTILRIVNKLMKRVPSDKADLAARAVYEATASPHARLRFLSLVGKRKSESQIISPELEEALRNDLRDYLKHAPAEALKSERELLRTVVQVMECDENSSELTIASAMESAVTIRLIESALSTSRSNTLGSVVVTSEDRLAWDALLSVFGGEERLSEAVAHVKEQINLQESDIRLRRAIECFDKYAAGWRPEEF